MSEKLKPCPFCGGQAIVGGAGKGNWIGCINSECFAQTRVFWNEREAINAWNTRTTDENLTDTVDAIIEELESATADCDEYGDLIYLDTAVDVVKEYLMPEEVNNE